MPTAEIISIGTELLLGQVLDTNAQFIAQELAKLGIDCFFRGTVGDNKERIKEMVRAGLSRSDLVITSGGLGPTADDLTTESLAELFKAPLLLDAAVLTSIRALFAERNLPMPATNEKQAKRPFGADILANPVGSAPGMIWELNGNKLREAGILEAERPRVILTFPGVPRELEVMWKKTAMPFLQGKFSKAVLWSVELKHYGIGESALAEKFARFLNGPNPTVAPYAGSDECRLRVTAKAETAAAAKKLAEPVVQQILSDSAQLCYGFDDDTLESVVGSALIAQNKTIAVAESCTGGLVSQRLTSVPGSSRYIKLNLVTYADEAKERLLNVRRSTLREYGAVSGECAKEMAFGIKALSRSAIGLSVTGIAGPGGGTAAKPIGLVYLGLCADDFYLGRRLDLGARRSRAEIRAKAASEALNMVRLFLLNHDLSQSEPKK